MACQFDKRIPEITNNLVLLYRHKTAADMSLGLAWYPQAHAIMLEWAHTYSYSIATVACVTAAISPQCSWERNLIIADDILAGRAVSIGGALHSNIRKAERIRNDRAGQITPYFPQGPKVASFACNLAGDSSIVTVDTHAMQAGLADVKADYRLPWKPYAVFAECYRLAAYRVKVAPADFQAIIWHTWKRLNPPASKRNKRRQWEVIGEY